MGKTVTMKLRRCHPDGVMNVRLADGSVTRLTVDPVTVAAELVPEDIDRLRKWVDVKGGDGGGDQGDETLTQSRGGAKGAEGPTEADDEAKTAAEAAEKEAEKARAKAEKEAEKARAKAEKEAEKAQAKKKGR